MPCAGQTVPRVRIPPSPFPSFSPVFFGRDIAPLKRVSQASAVRLAAELGVTSILSFAERMPGIIAAATCGELDRIALADASTAFGTIFIPLDKILMVQHDRRMARQPNRSSLRTLDTHVEE